MPRHLSLQPGVLFSTSTRPLARDAAHRSFFCSAFSIASTWGEILFLLQCLRTCPKSFRMKALTRLWKGVKGSGHLKAATAMMPSRNSVKASSSSSSRPSSWPPSSSRSMLLVALCWMPSKICCTAASVSVSSRMSQCLSSIMNSLMFIVLTRCIASAVDWSNLAYKSKMMLSSWWCFSNTCRTCTLYAMRWKMLSFSWQACSLMWCSISMVSCSGSSCTFSLNFM
mmetsp:Transcript_47819/g.123444  ORF Transcript_47819/g.123444 Transcript_47819/m.123444 type:complete len:226 (-) Transcript_47819:515-1192(-)